MTATVSIHQPNYLPWMGYFHKIYESDVFVFLDCVEFNSDSVTHRNRIKTSDGANWLTVPIASSSSANISELAIDTTQKWQKTHRKSIEAHYKGAEYFESNSEFLEIYEQREWQDLVSLNISLIRQLCDQLGVDAEMKLASEMNVEGSKTELLVDICKECNADKYFSGSGGREYHDESLFARAGVDVAYQDIESQEYPQKFGEFVPNLSIIDMVFNIGTAETVARIEGL